MKELEEYFNKLETMEPEDLAFEISAAMLDLTKHYLFLAKKNNAKDISEIQVLLDEALKCYTKSHEVLAVGRS